MDMIEGSATNNSSRPSVGVARTVGRGASIGADRHEPDVASTLLRVFDCALIVAMVAAPLLLTTLTPRDVGEQIHAASAEQTAQASGP